MFHAVKFGSLPVVIELVENGADVNHVAKAKKTPLFRARSYDIVKYLVQKGANPIQKVRDEKGKEKINAVDHLMEFNPDAAMAIFDSCLDLDRQGNLIIDFMIFECNDQADPTDRKQFAHIAQKEMELLNKAEEQSSLPTIDDKNPQKMMILHPLFQIFLTLKFRTIRFLFWGLLFLQAILVATLTTIGVEFVQFTACDVSNSSSSCFTNRYLDTLEIDICPNITEFRLTCDQNITSTNEGNALEQLCKIYYQDPNITITSCWTTHWFTIVTMIVLGIHFSKELFEFLSKGSRITYFLSLENILEIGILILACFFLWVSHYDIVLAYHASAWMVFFVWIDLLLYMGRMSLLGKYIFMSLHVIRILFVCLIAYLPIFFAFTFGYYILLQANDRLNGYIRGFISVVAMMIDEVDYGQFDYKEMLQKGGINGSTQVMTVFFMIFMSLILMNLLIAITVNNTEVLRDQSLIHISHRKISELNDVIQFRKWFLFETFYSSLMWFLHKIYKGELPSLNMGNPIFKDMEDNFKMVNNDFLLDIIMTNYFSLNSYRLPRSHQKTQIKPICVPSKNI